MLNRKIIPFTILLTLAASLLNSLAFGSASLIALFFYCIGAGLTSAMVFADLLIARRAVSLKLPTHIFIFLGLCLYIIIHGIESHTTGLTHYYWGAHAIYLVSLQYWAKNAAPHKAGSFLSGIRFLLMGVTIIAVLESLIVLLQYLGIFPVPSAYFKCTGTWANPNVTAMFLALSLFAVIWSMRVLFLSRHWIGVPALVIVILAILALQCRSAYLAAGVILFFEFGFSNIKAFARKTVNEIFDKNNKENYKAIFVGAMLIGVLLIVTTVFVQKTESAGRRLHIWENTREMIAHKAITGYGFGMFEKEYNYMAATQQNPTNEHINMPYNDFLQIGFEGGVIAFVFWTAFLVAFWYYCRRTTGLILSVSSVIIAFTVIQLTNFGFQAIPAMVLFLTWAALATKRYTPEPARVKNQLFNKVISAAGLVAALLYFLSISSLMSAFYQSWMISKKTPEDIESVHQYSKLSTQLAPYASYQEHLGDAYRSIGQYRLALNHYQSALKRSSNTDLFSKSAYSLQLLGSYDSSEYYYRIVQDMEPKKLLPKFNLLKLYMQKGDTLHTYLQARTILMTPAKVRRMETITIKRYADSVRKIWHPSVIDRPIKDFSEPILQQQQNKKP